MARKAKRTSSTTTTTTVGTTARKFTVPEVWRHIVKKNERHERGLYDVLICNHSVPANDNTYRKARSCPECRIKVQEYADRQRLQKPNAG